MQIEDHQGLCSFTIRIDGVLSVPIGIFVHQLLLSMQFIEQQLDVLFMRLRVTEYIRSERHRHRYVDRVHGQSELQFISLL